MAGNRITNAERPEPCPRKFPRPADQSVVVGHVWMPTPERRALAAPQQVDFDEAEMACQVLVSLFEVERPDRRRLSCSTG